MRDILQTIQASHHANVKETFCVHLLSVFLIFVVISLTSFTFLCILHISMQYDYWPWCGALLVLWLAEGSRYWDGTALGSLLLGLPAPPVLLSESDRSLSRSRSVPIEQLRDRPKPTPLLLLWLSWCWWLWPCPWCPGGDLLRRWWLLELDAAATETGRVCWLEMHEISTN